VTTTINVPYAIEGYLNNFLSNNHTGAFVLVAGDRKTPEKVADFCDRLSGRFDVVVRYVGVEEQERYLSRFPSLKDYVPYNSIQRRNVGMLMAYEEKAQVIITFDDDNLVTDGDYLKEHEIVGRRVRLPIVQTSTGWFNVCDYLDESAHQEFYHRGFPPGQRWKRASPTISEKDVTIVANAGLWRGDPDVDAITRLHRPLNVTGLNQNAPRRFALELGTWCPFDSQNTALARETIPAYFLSPDIGRYDDIWAGYVIRAIADHLGHYVSYGLPLVTQVRNRHNLWRDLDAERFGWQMTDALVQTIREVSLTGRTYFECAREIIDQVEARLGKLPNSEFSIPLARFLDGYQSWIESATSISRT
jgi:hypothetical protein